MKFLFLDRDGVINKDIGYMHKVSDIVYVDKVFDLIKRFSDSDYEIAIVTNQSGIGRGYFTVNEYLDVMNKIVQDIQSYLEVRKEIRIAVCPHTPWSGCKCRKPDTGLFVDIQNKEAVPIDWRASVMVGDKESDMLAGFKMGIGHLYKVTNDQNNYADVNVGPWAVVESLNEVLIPKDTVLNR